MEPITSDVDDEDDEEFECESSVDEDSESEGSSHSRTKDLPPGVLRNRADELYKSLKREGVEAVCRKRAGALQPLTIEFPTDWGVEDDRARLAAQRPSYERSPREKGPLDEAQVKTLRQQLEKELSKVIVKKVIFAGKEFIVELDAEGRQRRLRSVEEERMNEVDKLAQAVHNTSSNQPMTSLFKSQVDWQKHVRESEARFAYAQHRKGAENILQRKRFLSQVTVAEKATAKQLFISRRAGRS